MGGEGGHPHGPTLFPNLCRALTGKQNHPPVSSCQTKIVFRKTA